MMILGGLKNRMRIIIEWKTRKIEKERILRSQVNCQKVTKRKVGDSCWQRWERRYSFIHKKHYLFNFCSFWFNCSLSCFIQVTADYKAVSFTPDVMERRRMQSETLSAVFETYFRILKHSIQQTVARCVPMLLLEIVELNMNFLIQYVLSIRS